jgi:hypothetical protein
MLLIKIYYGRVVDSTDERIWRQTQVSLRENMSFHAVKLEKLLVFYCHSGYIVHEVHLLVASKSRVGPIDDRRWGRNTGGYVYPG